MGQRRASSTTFFEVGVTWSSHLRSLGGIRRRGGTALGRSLPLAARPAPIASLVTVHLCLLSTPSGQARQSARLTSAPRLPADHSDRWKGPPTGRFLRTSDACSALPPPVLR